MILIILYGLANINYFPPEFNNFNYFSIYIFNDFNYFIWFNDFNYFSYLLYIYVYVTNYLLIQQSYENINKLLIFSIKINFQIFFLQLLFNIEKKN